VRIVVTRPAEHAAELAKRLEALGYDVAVCPLIRVEPVGDGPVDVGGYDWVVVTSANGARELLRRRRGELPALAAVGPGTARALRAAGIEPALVPRRSTQEGLLEELPRPAGRVLFAAAAGARSLLPDAIGADVVVLYRTVELRPDGFPEGDLVVLASASAARAFAALAVAMPAVSIGPQTTAAARRAGVDVVAEAPTHDTDGLVTAIATVAG
jgi:uroporphyrinogen III methyltransferase/synthase